MPLQAWIQARWNLSDAVALFGKTEGFVAASPAVTPNTPDEVDF